MIEYYSNDNFEPGGFEEVLSETPDAWGSESHLMKQKGKKLIHAR